MKTHYIIGSSSPKELPLQALSGRVEGKYIYSSKTRNNVKVIDFIDFGLPVGISYNFGW